jgi:hypothetical protein
VWADNFLSLIKEGLKMKRSITRNLISIVIITMFLTLVLMPVTNGSAKNQGLNNTGQGARLAETTAVILYVTPDATGVNCSSWADPCDLQTALSKAIVDDQIWVAAGVHYPGPLGAYRTVTFHLKSEVALYGGFMGTETERQQRDWVANLTILSGDVDRNGALDDGNAYHVVTGNGVDESAILDGFTITGGNANGGNYSGGGMYNESSSPTLTNVTISANRAVEGGGMNNLASSPRLTNVTFSNNSAFYSGAGIYNNASSPTLTGVTFSGNLATNGGGGMYNIFNSNPVLTKVIFDANSADTGGGMDNYESSPSLNDVTFSGNSADKGGGMYNAFGKPTLSNTTFSGNSVTSWGGGMRNYFSDPDLTGVTFSANTAAGNGGGMYNENSNPTLTEVTFFENRAVYAGGATYNTASNPTLRKVTFSANSAGWGGAVYNSSSNPTLTNTIFTTNHASYCGGMQNQSSSPRLTNSIFSHNWAVYDGGGMCNESSSPVMINVTFSENAAVDNGGGMSNYSGNYSTLTNVILWGNTAISGAQIYNDGTSTTIVSYSIVQGGYAGTGNLDADPLFASAARGNLRLRSNSPAIDAGNNFAVPVGVTTDLNGDLRFADMPDIPDTGAGEAPIVDMGAYESHLLSIFHYLPLVTQMTGE